MSDDYLIWAAERLEKKYGWHFDDAQEWIIFSNYIPYDVSLQKYIEEKGITCKNIHNRWENTDG